MTTRALVVTGLVCSTATVSHSFGRSVYGLLVPAIEDDLGITHAEAAVPATAIYAAYVAGVVLVAAIGARFEPITIMRTGLAVAALGLVVSGTATSLGSLTVGVALTGMAGAGIWLTAPVLATAFVPAHRRGLVIGLLLSTIGVSNIVLGFVTNALRDRAGDDTLWRPVVQIETVVTLVLLVGLIAFARYPPTSRIDGGFSVDQLRLVPGWLKLTIAYALFGGMTAAFASFVLAALEEQGGFSRNGATLVFTAMGIGGVVLAPTTGALSDRFGRLQILALSLTLLLLANLFIALGPKPIVAVGAVLYGSAAGATPALVATYVRDHVEDRTFSRVLATMTLLFSIMAAVTPAIIGGVADATGSFTAPYLLMAAMTAVSVAAVVALRDTDRDGTDRMAAPAVS